MLTALLFCCVRKLCLEQNHQFFNLPYLASSSKEMQTGRQQVFEFTDSQPGGLEPAKSSQNELRWSQDDFLVRKYCTTLSLFLGPNRSSPCDEQPQEDIGSYYGVTGKKRLENTVLVPSLWEIVYFLFRVRSRAA